MFLVILLSGKTSPLYGRQRDWFCVNYKDLVDDFIYVGF